MCLSDEENSPAYLTSSISTVDRYPWICSQTALSPTDLLLGASIQETHKDC